MPGLLAQFSYMVLLTIFWVPGPVLVLFYPPPHTPRVEPDQTMSASGQGIRDNRGGAPNPQGHRGPIQVWITQRKFEWEGSQSVPTHCFVMATGYTAFRGSISRSHDTSFQRPLDTRRHRVNKIEEGGGTVAHGHHNTPDPQATMAMSSVGLSGMLNSLFIRSADRPLCSIQALVFRFPTREED